MDLSLATVEQIAAELNRRGLEFSLVVSPEQPGEPHPNQSHCELYSSPSDPLHQALHFLLGGLSILGNAADDLEDEDDGKAESYRRWQLTGEALLNDVLRTGQEWAEGEEVG